MRAPPVSFRPRTHSRNDDWARSTNPMSAAGTIELTVPTSQHVRVAIYDMLGREVMVVFDREISASQRAMIFMASPMECALEEQAVTFSLIPMFLLSGLGGAIAILTAGQVISDSVVGIRSHIGEGARVERSVLLGADFYETSSAAAANDVPVGIGANVEIERAIIDKRLPLSGRLKRQQQVFLFGDAGDDIASAVIVPLHGKGWGGVLSIGSRDSNRFTETMGVELLANLGEILSFILKPWIVEED